MTLNVLLALMQTVTCHVTVGEYVSGIWVGTSVEDLTVSDLRARNALVLVYGLEVGFDGGDWSYEFRVELREGVARVVSAAASDELWDEVEALIK